MFKGDQSRRIKTHRCLVCMKDHLLIIASSPSLNHKNIEKNNNRSFRNREDLQYKKTADSVLLSLFMRTNGKCNNSHAP